MRGPCGPRKTLPGDPAAFFGTPEQIVCLIVHNSEPLSKTTFQATVLCFWGPRGPRRH